MKAPGLWAGIGAIVLLLAAPVMVSFGAIMLLAPPEAAPEAPERLLGGGLLAALGLVVTGVLLLIGRSRPEHRRRGWHMASFIVMIAAMLLGPVYGIGSYVWVTTVGM